MDSLAKAGNSKYVDVQASAGSSVVIAVEGDIKSG